MKRKSLMVLLVLTLMSSVLFAQSALGANLYLAGGQKASNAQYSVTYKGLVSVIGGKLKPVNIGTQRVYYVYTNADQGVGYYKVFVNRYFGWNPPSDDQPQEPHLPQPPEQPEEPHQPPIQPEPKPEGPKQPAPKPEELKQPEPNPEQPQQPGAYQLTADEQKLINLINSERTKAGLKPLAIDYNLCKVARIKSEDMRANNYFSHSSPTYGSPFQMMKDFGITYRSAAENIARTYSVDSAHTGFMNSEGHRKNILTPGFTHVGVGISGNYYTEMFISK
ncbi:MAG: CAP domain-containing protein [Clostridia bacterium]